MSSLLRPPASRAPPSPRARSPCACATSSYSLYTDHDFADLFPTRGQPAACPWRLGVITILQFLEGLSDRQAADAVRSRIDWKYLLGLELTDPGFHFTVLHGFRTRLVEGQAELRLLTVMLERLREEGLLKAGGRQRTDSTHVLAAVRTMNRLELVGETVRHALNRLAVVAPDWLRAQVPRSWVERYGRAGGEHPAAQSRRPSGRRWPPSSAPMASPCFRPPATAGPGRGPEEPAIAVLGRIWLQQYYAPDDAGAVRWRRPQDLPPPERWIHSPYDVEARFSIKRGLLLGRLQGPPDRDVRRGDAPPDRPSRDHRRHDPG